jgi:hypothetical protein
MATRFSLFHLHESTLKRFFENRIIPERVLVQVLVFYNASTIVATGLEDPQALWAKILSPELGGPRQ